MCRISLSIGVVRPGVSWRLAEAVNASILAAYGTTLTQETSFTSKYWFIANPVMPAAASGTRICRSVPMFKGTVKWFNNQKGFGFIQREDGEADAFVHISAVERSGLTSLAEGQAVEFELAPGRNGKMAAQNLKIAD